MGWGNEGDREGGKEGGRDGESPTFIETRCPLSVIAALIASLFSLSLCDCRFLCNRLPPLPLTPLLCDYFSLCRVVTGMRGRGTVQVHDWDIGGSELVGRAEVELHAAMER